MFLVNGQRILVKGVNRAETDPDTGRYVTRQAQRRDLMLMKRLHINGVRTSHYPSDPYWYDLADRYGLWVADEVDIETHAHVSCPTDCLASKPEWQDAFADRFRAMVERDKNHPSVIFWDTGNEAGLGTAHFAMADWATANDPTRLLYHQPHTNPNGDAPFAHVNGVRYRTPADMERRAATTDKPIVMGEYAHAQGNGLGNLDQFWTLARRYPSLQGGFIWDWADANLRQPLVFTPDSSRNRIQTFLVGKPGQAPGRRGQAVALSGLDDFVNTFRDPRLDVGGTALTLDAWVRPGSWGGSFPILTKGQQYGLQMRDERTLEFGVETGGETGVRQAVAAAVPEDWYGGWHRVTGVYDGTALRLYVDGRLTAEAPHTGGLRPGLYEVNVGRNAETQQEGTRTRLGHGLVDDVRVYPVALTAAQLSTGADPAAAAVLALDFDRYLRRGEFQSLGISLSGTDGMVGTDRYLQPETVELAWTQAPVRFTAVDVAAGKVRVHNEQQAGAFDARLRWSLVEVNRVLRSGSVALRLEPGRSVDLDLGPAPANPRDVERWLNLSAVNTRPVPWAPNGWRLGYDQFAAGGRVVPGVQSPPSTAPPPRLTDTGSRVVVAGRGWTYAFDKATGTLTSMDGRGGELLRQGPQLDVYRPPTSNETFRWGTADREVWHRLGIDRLRVTVGGVTTSTEADGAAVVEVRSTAAGPDTAALASFHQVMRYRIDRTGTITLAHSVRPEGSGAVLAAVPAAGRVLGAGPGGAAAVRLVWPWAAGELQRPQGRHPGRCVAQHSGRRVRAVLAAPGVREPHRHPLGDAQRRPAAGLAGGRGSGRERDALRRARPCRVRLPAAAGPQPRLGHPACLARRDRDGGDAELGAAAVPGLGHRAGDLSGDAAATDGGRGTCRWDPGHTRTVAVVTALMGRRHISPHSEFSATAVRDLERRWGLTLVSFVPGGSAAPLLRLQQFLQSMLDRHLVVRPDEPMVEFYDVEQLHCTHLTLTRSSAWGPVRVTGFVKPGIDPQQLCDVLAREAQGLGTITVRLDRLVLSDNGFLLFGSCADEDSVARRFRLLERLNTQLPGYVNLGRRAWDTDPARYGAVHMRVGFVKRPCGDYESLVAKVARSSIDPITLTFADVTLVHHRYRSLRAPHAGSLRFPLNGRAWDDRGVPSFGHLNLLR